MRQTVKKNTIKDRWDLACKNFKVGESVAFRMYNSPNLKWKIGTIIAQDGNLHFTVSTDGQTFRRHVNQMRSTGIPQPTNLRGPIGGPGVPAGTPTSSCTLTSPHTPTSSQASNQDTSGNRSSGNRTGSTSSSAETVISTGIQHDPPGSNLTMPGGSPSTTLTLPRVPVPPMAQSTPVALRRSKRDRKPPARLVL
ncbi:hypothetical protein GE061_007531 [Apolygus lucorum]|uniref:Uncharacterized protein n=1 Tax=Apolygus lucorum TaxID=248454 RepID=A0A8S9WW06_APOLU|nr:hypothetical protein GE061_007531 [Apolygus lucorum]